MSTMLQIDKEDIINDILESMLNVDGLDGAMTISPAGELLGAVMPGIYDDSSLEEVSAMVANTMMTLRELKIRPTTMAYRFQGITIIVSDLKKGFLVTMSQPSISAPLLKIATNVARKKLTDVLSDKPLAGKGVTRSGVKVKRSKHNNATEPPAAEPAAAPSAPQLASSPAPVGITSSQNISMSASQNTSVPNLLFTEEERLLPPRQGIFMGMLRSLIAQAVREDLNCEKEIKEAIAESVSNLGVNAATLGTFRQWLDQSSEILDSGLGESDMQNVVHGLYIFLCEYFGPVTCDQMVARSMREVRQLPQAPHYPPNNLL